MKRLILEYDKCIGCRLCELACSAEKESVYNPKKARIRATKIGIPEQIIIVYCRHCENAACISACPVEAISRNQIGAVIIDKEKCIGCGSCISSCPAQAIFEGNKDDSIPIKCDLCDGDPKCIKACIRDAINYGEYEMADLDSPTEILKKELKKSGLTLEEFNYSIEDE